MKLRFDHEKLEVYKKSIDLVAWVSKLTDSIQTKHNVVDHLNRAADSISLNIAEGNGKFTSKDKCRFFDISRGSALEVASCLDVMVKRNLITMEDAEFGKEIVSEIVKMLIGLIKSKSNRVYEDTTE
jgi:four helix bundle protein